jgi:hypothetical protein
MMKDEEFKISRSDKETPSQILIKVNEVKQQWEAMEKKFQTLTDTVNRKSPCPTSVV